MQRIAGLLVAVGLGCTASAESVSAELSSLKLPPGFTISMFASDVPGARSMARGEDGTIFVGSRDDRVYAVRDSDGDGDADKVVELATSLNMPNGVAVFKGDVYVAEIHQVSVWRGLGRKFSEPLPKREIIKRSFPTDRHHGWKFIAFGPDGKLYVPVGAPCNICEKEDPYSSITRMNPDGSEFEIVARGVRNSVGFDWHPTTRELWFTDNGRDMLGDDVPPCELNRVTKLGQHFGYPYCHGGDIPDPEFGKKRACKEFRPPMYRLQAHAAPLAIHFYQGKQFPKTYQNQIILAEHGSWNRSRKVGYRLMVARLDTKSQVVSYEPFVDGFLNEKEQEAWGRPVDILELPDGSLLISDDKQGALYRVSYAR
ncbi:MAG: PQQ-dependent sugar dehydrogenase [Myxococcales bacterium]|nr:PQQ-dependent sugar dehydrogenase [Myxococcales bacterium]